MALSKTKKVLFTCATLFILFLSVEIVVRVAYYMKYHNINWLIAPFKVDGKSPVIYKTNMDYIFDEKGEILYFKYKPGVYTNKASYDGKDNVIRYYINKCGFRNRDIALLKDGYRIICFDGSATVGLESPDDQTWPAYLNQFLSKGNIEVINMAVTGHNSYEIFNLLSMEAYKYKPDLVLLYMGRNDIHHNRGNLVMNKWYDKLLYFIHSHILYYKVMSYTYIIEKVSVLKQGNADPFLFFPYNPYPEFIKNFNKILDFCENNKIKIAYICEVKNYNGDPQRCMDLLDKISRDKNFKRPNKTDLKEGFIINLFKLQEIVRDICKERKDIQFIDPRTEFYEVMLKNNKQGDKKDFFSDNNMDPAHLTPLGNEVLSDVISEKIRL